MQHEATASKRALLRESNQGQGRHHLGESCLPCLRSIFNISRTSKLQCLVNHLIISLCPLAGDASLHYAGIKYRVTATRHIPHCESCVSTKTILTLLCCLGVCAYLLALVVSCSCLILPQLSTVNTLRATLSIRSGPKLIWESVE